MKILKFIVPIHILFYFVIGIVLFSSCKVLTKPSVVKGNSGKVELQYYFTEALRMQYFGNYKRSLELYKRCLDIDNSSAGTHYQLSIVYSANYDFSKAEYHAKQAILLNSSNYWYWYNLIKIYSYFKKNTELIVVYEDMVKKFPEKLDILYDLAGYYIELGDTKKSLDLLNKIEAKSGITEIVSLTKYKIYSASDDPTKAIHELEVLISNFPSEPSYLVYAVNHFRAQKDTVKQYEYLESLKLLSPDSKQYLTAYFDYLFDTKNDEGLKDVLSKITISPNITTDEKFEILASILQSQKKLKSISSSIFDAIVFIKDSISKEKYLLLKAEFFMGSDSINDALECLSEYLILDKKNKVVWHQLISISEKLGKDSLKNNFLDSAIVYFPVELSFFVLKAYSLFTTEKFNEMILLLERDELNNIENGYLQSQRYGMLGEAYHKKEDIEKAFLYYSLALERDPENIMILNNYAYYLSVRAERLDKAESMSKRSLEIEPDNATFLDTYAWILYKQKKLKLALQYIELAIKKGGFDSSEVVDHYADILYCSGNIKDAQKNWKLAIELGGNADIINKKLNKFECFK